MVNKKSWQEFRECGMHWWINMILHTLGWALVVEIEDDGTISSAYPARVKFRGFSEKDNEKGYQDISRYMVENAVELEKESQE